MYVDQLASLTFFLSQMRSKCINFFNSLRFTRIRRNLFDEYARRKTENNFVVPRIRAD